MSLRAKREAAGLTQAKVAEHLGVCRYQYIKMEKDPGMVSMRQAMRLADLFGCSISDIFLTGNYKQTYRKEA